MQGFNPNPNPYPEQQTNIQIYQNNTPVSQDIRRSFLADDNNYAADVNSLIAKKRSNHVRSLISSIILVGGIVTFVVLYFTQAVELSAAGIGGICAGFYLFYLLLGLACNPLFSYLGHIDHGANFQASYNKVRGLSGHFSFSVVCYHYETRYHTRTVRDSNGNTRTQTYTTQQKVITHTASEQVIPKQCRDQSGHADQVRAATDIIFVHNRVNYKFRDEQSRRDFEYLWASFQNRHRRDVHQDYSQNFVIPGLVARVCFYVGEQPKNYSCLLVLWALLGLIWPYSMYLESKISRFDIEYMKVVGI